MSDKPIVNPLHESVAHKLDPDFAAIYMKHQSTIYRADQVPYEVYNQDRPKYSFPTHLVATPRPEVGSAKIHRVPVLDPAGEINVEIYHPTPDAVAKGGFEREGKLPAVIDFHGGGFVIGTLKADESWCGHMTQMLGCVAVNVEYRMAPEYPHPVPAMDCWTAVKWVVQNAEELNVDITRIAVGGLSAGGCLAAVVSILARDDPSMPPLVAQLLVVPVLDARFIPEEGSCDPKSTPYESYITYEFAPMLPLARLVWFYNLWLGSGEERKAKTLDFRASPMLAENLNDLPPASFHIAEIDPLYSEAIVYHEKLLAAGNKSTLKVYKGCGHPFAHWDAALPAAMDYVKDSAEVLMEAFKLP